jgi:hypothetical protein
VASMKRRLTLGLLVPVVIGMIAVTEAMHVPTHTIAIAAPSSPPPPPTFIPTPIGPPPGPPTTPTLTPVATPTAAPTATTAPLGASARIVASARVQRQGKMALVHWRMAFQLGIKGFRIYAGRTLLTRSLIHPHHSPNYTARVAWVRGVQYVLQVLYKNGHAQRFPIH